VLKRRSIFKLRNEDDMKKQMFLKILYILIIIGSLSVKAQDITFIPQDTLLVDTLGAEMIFNIDVTNISSQDQTIYMVRTLNDLPSNWQSSLCFSLCFAPFIDSIATTMDFGSSPLTPGETREVSLHVFAQNNPGTAHVKIKAGTFRSPTITYNVNLTAIAGPTSANDKTPSLNDFSLSQNYPNPFNPTTKIRFIVPSELKRETSKVTLIVYGVLGNEVATLVNEEKAAGTYEVEFNPASSVQYPTSGIYYYRLSVGDFTQTRKMILEK
jgi:hypothetical protein